MKGDERRITRVIRNRADQTIPDQTKCSRFGLLGIVIVIRAKTDQKENKKGQSGPNMEGLVQIGCGGSRSIRNEDGDDWKRNNGEVDISGVNQPFQFF